MFCILISELHWW